VRGRRKESRVQKSVLDLDKSEVDLKVVTVKECSRTLGRIRNRRTRLNR
jgi:hypothetical protein